MFLSRVELKPNLADHPAFWGEIESLYSAHQALWQLFSDGPDRKRDFLFRQERGGSKARFYLQSSRKPVDQRAMWTIETKPFAPRLRKGQALRFAVRINPTQRASAGPAAGKRHDVVMHAKRSLRKEGKLIFEPAAVQGAGEAWIRSRGERAGFVIEEGNVRVEGYRQVRIRRREDDIQFSTVDCEGLLTVMEPEQFWSMLRAGLGPAKAFGCGLMLIRPA